jgi:hypothetical protein
MVSLPLLELVQETPFRNACICPNCWHTFAPSEVLWIAAHPKLTGEPQLPQRIDGDEQQRFIPERFSVDGKAIDKEGALCTQLACPHCKLLIPRASLELSSLVFSILGAPGSGKSVFLASMTFAIRQLAEQVGLRFQDADLTLNELLIEDERRLFLDTEGDGYRAINVAVAKTQLNDARYRRSRINGQWAKFVPPFTFQLGPAKDHPYAKEYKTLSRLLCLYDNAGEHFQPGAYGATRLQDGDAGDMPMTGHLKKSKGLIYTFDPMKYHKVRHKLADRPAGGSVGERQDSVLLEAVNRIRDAGLSQSEPLPQPLAVVLTKFDVWKSLLPEFKERSLLQRCPNSQIDALQLNEVDEVSNACKSFLREHCPEIVSTAQSVSSDVKYFPVAAVGWDVKPGDEAGVPQFRAGDCKPFGVHAPLMWLLNKNAPRLCLGLRFRGK